MKNLNLLCIGLAIFACLAFTGLLIADDASGEDELSVDAWIPAKYLHPGDTMEIYAETSYGEGVDVEADVYYYEVSALESLNYYQIPENDPIFVETVPMEFGEGELYTDEFWIGEFMIPEDAEGGMYGVSVTASDGQDSAVDDSHSRLSVLMTDHVAPLQDSIITFRDGDLQNTMDDVIDDLGDFNDTLEANGGIPGVAHDVTDIQEWDNLTTVGKAQSNMSDAAYFLEALLEDFLQSDEYPVFENFAYSFRNNYFDMNDNYLRDEISTSMYETIMYLLGFDEDTLIMSHIMDLEATGDIADAYTALQATAEYQQWKHSMQMIQDFTKPVYYAQEMMSGMISLAYSEEFMDLLDAFEAYLQETENYDPGNSPTQNLIHRATQLDGEEMENLMGTPEFEQWLAALNETSLKDVVDGLNDTMNAIVDEIEAMIENSDQLGDLEDEMHEFQMFTGGVDEWYDFYFEDESGGTGWTNYFDVPDAEWLMDFIIELDLRIYEEGTVWINITDPDGYTDEYEFASNFEWGEYFGDDLWFDAIPGEWELTFETSSSANGWAEIYIRASDDAFMDYFVLETVEELFFVQNAGIAVQAPMLTMTHETVEIEIAVYNGEGPLPDTDVDVLIGYGDPLTQYQQDVWGYYEWHEDWGSSGSDSDAIYVNSGTGALVLEFNIENIELDDTVTFTLIAPDGTDHEFEYGFLDSGTHDETIDDPALGQWDYSITVDGDDTGDGSVEMFVGYDPEPVPMPFWFVSTQSMARIISQETMTTDNDGILTLEIDAEEAGAYVYFIELPLATGGEQYAAAVGGFVAMEFGMVFDLEQVGEIMGIPVYENPEGLGNTLDFDITLTDDTDATVFVQIMPMDLGDLFEDIDMDAVEDDDELTYTNEHIQEASLTVNSPISIIAAMGVSPDDENVQQYSLFFGFLITSDTEVNVYSVDPLAPGDTYELEINVTEGTPGSTYGIAMHENWLDMNTMDTGQFTAYMFAGAWADMIEIDPETAAEGMNSMIYGEGGIGYTDIPNTVWEDDIVLFTITDVENGGDHSIGVYFGDGVKPVPVLDIMSFELLTADPIVNETIEMKMTDNAGDPLNGVAITITLDGEYVTDVVSGADGTASFEVGDPGTYHVEATNEGYSPVEDDIVVRGEDDPEERLQINVPGGELIEDEVLMLTVVDKDTGLPVNGASVTVLSGLAIIDTGFTNPLGQISFTLAAGQFTVRAEKTDYTKDETTLTVIEKEKPEDDPGVIPGFEIAIMTIAMLGAAMVFSIRRRS